MSILTPAEKAAQASAFEAWEAQQADIIAAHEEREQALRKGVLTYTQDMFEYEWYCKNWLGKDDHCILRLNVSDSELSLYASTWNDGCPDISGEPARLLTAWLIERGFGPRGSA